MQRITSKHLEAKILDLNLLTGSPSNFRLDSAYGGYELQRMRGTGCSKPLNTGHIPARQLAGLIDAMAVGIRLQKIHDEAKIFDYLWKLEGLD